MATKSPTSLRSREVIGVDQFSQRREVFDKYDTVFVPAPSPASLLPVYKDGEPIVTSNHGKTTSNFKRNTMTYSSMRDTRDEDRNFEFRTRKYSDNFTAEMNQVDDDVDYRYSMTERTRRLSKLRRDFLNSNLYEPNSDGSFTRTGVRASLPARNSPMVTYKIESPNLYKFPFAEPYATPPPIRKVVVDLGSTENGVTEKEEPMTKSKSRHQSLPTNNNTSKNEHQKLFEELVKRYSPQRKPVDWKLPPTRPRVVGSVPKSFSSVASDSIDSTDKKTIEDNLGKYGDDEVFINQDINSKFIETEKKATLTNNHVIGHVDVKATKDKPMSNEENVIQNDQNKIHESVSVKVDDEVDKKDEIDDKVPEPVKIKSNKPLHRVSLEKFNDPSIPALIEKMTEEAEGLENRQKIVKKVKRKRSFWDKIMGRKK